jgi:hypothetical protein
MCEGCETLGERSSGQLFHELGDAVREGIVIEDVGSLAEMTRFQGEGQGAVQAVAGGGDAALLVVNEGDFKEAVSVDVGGGPGFQGGTGARLLVHLRFDAGQDAVEHFEADFGVGGMTGEAVPESGVLKALAGGGQNGLMEGVPKSLALLGLGGCATVFDVLEELSFGVTNRAADTFFCGASAMNGAVVE